MLKEPVKLAEMTLFQYETPSPAAKIEVLVERCSIIAASHKTKRYPFAADKDGHRSRWFQPRKPWVDQVTTFARHAPANEVCDQLIIGFSDLEVWREAKAMGSHIVINTFLQRLKPTTIEQRLSPLPSPPRQAILPRHPTGCSAAPPARPLLFETSPAAV